MRQVISGRLAAKADTLKANIPASAMTISVLGEALMDCVEQPDGSLRPLMGGSPFNLARAAALRGANVAYLNPLSTDKFGQQLQTRLAQDGVQLPGGHSPSTTKCWQYCAVPRPWAGP